MNKQINYKKIIGIGLILNIIWLSVIGVIVYSQANNNFTISTGLYPQATYTIYKEGSIYYAKNGYGELLYTNTNSSLIVQNTMNLIPTVWGTEHLRGGIVHFGVGEFTVQNVTLPSYVTIEGEGTRASSSLGTIFNVVSDNYNVFNIVGEEAFGTNSKRAITIRNIRFNGDWKNSRAIYANNTHHLNIISCTIAGFSNNAIYALNCWEWQIRDSYFESNGNYSQPLETAVIKLEAGETIGATNCNGWIVENNVFSASHATNFYGKNTLNKPVTGYPYHNVFWLVNNWFHGASTVATRPNCSYALVGNFSELYFMGNNLVYSNEGFITISSVSYSCHIMGNTFSNLVGYTITFETYAPPTGNVPRQGIHIISDNTIRYNLIGETTNPEEDGVIYFDSKNLEASNNIVYARNATFPIIPLVKKGVNAIGVKVDKYQFLRNNETETYYSENYAVTEASNDDWIIHNLTGTPTNVELTIEETDANYYLQLKTSNATHFQIYLYDSTAGALEAVDKTIHWYAEHKP